MEDQENVFEAPKAPLVAALDQMKVPLYSPNQIAAGAFLGGALSAVYMLWSNFKRLNRSSEATLTVAIGSVFVIAMIVVLPFLPRSFPNMAIPLAYTLTAKAIANKVQVKKADIAAFADYVFESNWRVAAVALVGLTLLVIAIFAGSMTVLTIKGS